MENHQRSNVQDSNRCTSVSASDEFLVVTTLEHTLLCLPLSALLSDGQWTQVEG